MNTINFIENDVIIEETTEERISPAYEPFLITTTKKVTVEPGPGSYSDMLYANVSFYRNGQLLNTHNMPATVEALTHFVGASVALYLLG